ncbi:MAG: hypothetical protein LBC07_03740, partial [Elusimicrobiota bacterium]|nr:hypothetical protein [Elusimicrobiota bacterium]
PHPNYIYSPSPAPVRGPPPRPPPPPKWSAEAQAVFNSGLELWKYYHKQIQDIPNANVNASLYDIKEFFCKRNDNGKLNSNSNNEVYNNLISALRKDIEVLTQKIQPKVYQYEFLKK